MILQKVRFGEDEKLKYNRKSAGFRSFITTKDGNDWIVLTMFFNLAFGRPRQQTISACAEIRPYPFICI